MAVSVLVALAVGVNGAMFGVIDRLLLRGPAHVRSVQEIGRVYSTRSNPTLGESTGSIFGFATYVGLRDQVRAFSGVAAYRYSPGAEVTLDRGEQSTQASKADVTWNFFPVLGTAPQLGRFFSREEDQPDAAQHVVVLGDGLWHRRYRAALNVLGQTVAVDGIAYTIVGVAPAGFTGVELGPVDLWLPMSLVGPQIDPDHWRTATRTRWLNVIVRLNPAFSLAAANGEATAVLQALSPSANAAKAGRERLSVRPVRNDPRGKEATEITISRWLAALSLVVLLTAGANATNLLLARAIRQRRDVAIQVALGLGTGRLMRGFLLQSLILSSLGGVLALGIVPVLSAGVRSNLLPGVEWPQAALQPRVLAVIGALALAMGLLAGAVAVAIAFRRDLFRALRTSGRGESERSSRLQAGLAIAQVALSVALLISAGLFVRSFVRALSVPMGVDVDRVLTIAAHWPTTERHAGNEKASQSFRADEERSNRFYSSALDRIRGIPGIESAALAIGAQFSGALFEVGLKTPGTESLSSLSAGGPYIHAISPGYLRTLGLRLLRGRDFTTTDRAGSERVALVSATMAQQLWSSLDPIGACLIVGDDNQTNCSRVVGIVGDAHQNGLRDKPAMHYYVPLGQEEEIGGLQLLVRPEHSRAAWIERLRRELKPVDSTALWIDVEPLDRRLVSQRKVWRVGSTLIGGFGGLALLVAALGLYSLVTESVGNRMYELGVRLALGAQRQGIFALVLRHGLGLTAMGIVGGTAIGFVSSPFLSPLLFETPPRDAAVFLTAGLVLVTSALAACTAPAWRAAHTDPAVSLRCE
jgi:predicted permease